MVEDAQCEPVADLIGPSVRVPPDVCRLQPDKLVVESDIEAAHDAASLVRPQDGMAETAIAGGGSLRLKPFLNGPREPDRVADRVVPGGRKVLAEDPLRCLLDKFGIGQEHPLIGFAETTGGRVIDQLTVGDSSFALDPVQVRVGDDLPQIVSAQPGKWGFGVEDGPWPAEAAEQLPEVLGDFGAVPGESLLSALDATKCEEQQQRLVRGPIVAAPPELDVVYAAKEVLSGHVGQPNDLGSKSSALRMLALLPVARMTNSPWRSA